MLTRLEAMSDINLGRGIQLTFKGRFTTFNVIVRRCTFNGGAVAHIECPVMRKTYKVFLTTKQTMAYIKRHYTRYDQGVSSVRVQADLSPLTYKECA